MKKRMIFLFILFLLLIAVPVTARIEEPVGGQIDILQGTPNAYDADAPFHITHGWEINPRDGYQGKMDFELYFDGKFRNEDYKYRTVGPSDDTEYVKLLWVHNFPEGMRGLHTFTGIWYAPCSYAKERGYIGECKMPSERVAFLTKELTVLFVP